MIYESPAEDDPIRQGDIFVGVPRVDFNLDELVLIRNDEPELCSWPQLASAQEPVSAIVKLRSVAAIVASQDCDAVSAPDITLYEVRNFRDVERMAKDTQKADRWMRIITQHARINQKWFYLPPDDRIGFSDKMGVDFLVTIRLGREELEGLRHLRTGRLNQVAREHFRERLSEFYRRYPVDEWYALNAEELEAYRKDHPDAEPYPWQSSG